MSEVINKKACPFCKNENNCLLGISRNCWCFSMEVPTTLMDLVPVKLKQESCICLSCINSYMKNSELFKNKYDL
ncbi:MAG: hypothetical protein ACI808_000876 [Paraglaciecola sp.]|jgi:hypothetical protein